MAEISKTADQALALVLLIAEQGSITASAAARRLGINRTVAHRLLATLQQRSLVQQRKSGFVVGPTVLRLANHVEPQLRFAFAGPIEQLAENLGETIVIHVQDGPDAVVLEQTPGNRHLVRVEHEIGSRHPLHVGASGRAILAFLDQAEIEKVLKRVDRVDEVKARLEEVRALGYAISHDELQRGVHGIAAPIIGPEGFAVASAAILIPKQRATSLGAFSDQLIAFSRKVDSALSEGIRPLDHRGDRIAAGPQAQ